MPLLQAPRLSPSELLSDLQPDLRDPAALLLVQDLDGVCMDLVLDPLQRRLDAAYVQQAPQLDGSFCVLTNGEHEGRRGVNRLVERCLGLTDGLDRSTAGVDPRAAGLYLPGLAAGGVQLQNRQGQVSTPGVGEAELAFLKTVPQRLTQALTTWLPQLLPALTAAELEQQIALAVLDNPLSPTLNLNGLFSWVAERHDGPVRVSLQRQLQEGTLVQMEALLVAAAAAGLADSFFLHIAPNVLDDHGREQPVWASPSGVGSTDVQLLLRGAIKEAGLLVLINQHIARHHGTHPLGADFNVRTAPHSLTELLALAEQRIPAALMPRLVGVGDTITSSPGPRPGEVQRGGSDRGFLSLLQELGRRFNRCNRVVLVDSSGGEVSRPSMADGRLEGLSDPADPLELDALFPGGPAQYRRFFGELAAAAGRQP
jgi:glucosylglycerol 3-phosphatase